jgi:hypothetical protein
LGGERLSSCFGSQILFWITDPVLDHRSWGGSIYLSRSGSVFVSAEGSRCRHRASRPCSSGSMSRPRPRAARRSRPRPRSGTRAFALLHPEGVPVDSAAAEALAENIATKGARGGGPLALLASARIARRAPGGQYDGRGPMRALTAASRKTQALPPPARQPNDPQEASPLRAGTDKMQKDEAA